MNYYESLLRTVEFIEENLRNNIDLEQIASTSGFSKYHFLRIFKSISGVTVFDYIRKRRLTLAANDLIHTNDTIVNIAFNCGYESQESFTRAFKDMYNATPNVYRINKMEYSNLNKLVLSEIIKPMEGEVMMKPEIIEKKGCYIVGMQYEGKNQNGEVSKLWNEFLPRLKEITNRVNDTIGYGYETYNKKMFETGEFTYVAGVEVENLDHIPSEMVGYEIPSNTYAVFTMEAIIENLPKTIGKIYSEYLPQNNLKPIDNYDFEYYTEEFEPNQKDAKLYFYVPIMTTKK